MNNGHFWTEKEDKALLKAWFSFSGERKDYVREYAGDCGFSEAAVSSRLKKLLKEQPAQQEEEGATFEQGDDFINVICASRRMLTKEDVIREFKIDTDLWEVEKFKVKTSEGYRKDRRVKWV